VAKFQVPNNMRYTLGLPKRPDECRAIIVLKQPPRPKLGYCTRPRGHEGEHNA